MMAATTIRSCSLPAPLGGWLTVAPFADSEGALLRLQQLQNSPLGALLLSRPELASGLANSASADRALLGLERFLDALARNEDRYAGLAHSLVSRASLLPSLLIVFGASDFLTEVLLRHPEDVAVVPDGSALARSKGPQQMTTEARQAPQSGGLDGLRRWQHRELLRIGAGDLLGVTDLPSVTRQLSHLAAACIEVCLESLSEALGLSVEGLAVIAQGKLGGAELNYSSDVDLLLIARDEPQRHIRLGGALVQELERVTVEGFLYRVDLRLRPWGTAGPPVSSLAGYRRYLDASASLWERQALLKARCVAGDRAVGRAFARAVRPQVCAPDAEAVRAEVSGMKRRIEDGLARRGEMWGEVKLGVGSIRDVEFVAQYLQLAHGTQVRALRQANTQAALSRLREVGLLSAEEHRALSEGYTFLRSVEHCLQLMHYHQTHALPRSPQELAYLARRLGFQGADAGEQFLARYEQHTAAIRAAFERHMEARTMSENSSAAASSAGVSRHVERMAPEYTAAFGEAQIRRHAILAACLGGDHLLEVEAEAMGDALWRVTIVAFDYIGELSMICGLLFAYGCDIRDGQVFTYEREADRPTEAPLAARKIVDVFTVALDPQRAAEGLWQRYAQDLANLLRLLRARQMQAAQGELAARVAAAVRSRGGTAPALYPVDVRIDNASSPRHTVLEIDAPDTVGFLYEFTNAVAAWGLQVERMTVDSVAGRVRDVLYLTDARGAKITDPERQGELRAVVALVKHFTHLLPQSPDPERALGHFQSFVAQLLMRPNWRDDLTSLTRPEVLEALARLLGVSDFLWDDFLRMQYENLLPVLQDVAALSQPRSKEELASALMQEVGQASPQQAADALNAFKDREMFRIDMRHIQSHADFEAFSAELSDLAEVVVEVASRLCDEALRAEYGEPRDENGRYSPLAVCALGKLGGREIGYASDIELMFVYRANGPTAGPTSVATSEYYDELVRRVLGIIRARREGIFEIDLRLRPYGQAGSLAASMEAFRRYFGRDGAAWPYERQALTRLRPIAGDSALGAEVTALRDACVYTGQPFDRLAMRAMRERQLRHLVAGGALNAKFSRGGLVDAEYLVQGLQVTHGHRDARLRVTNTQRALAALAEAGLLAPADYVALREAHRFLRNLIDALRMVRGNARDLTVPPAGSEGLAFLARRLGYGDEVDRLQADITRHMGAVQRLVGRV